MRTQYDLERIIRQSEHRDVHYCKDADCKDVIRIGMDAGGSENRWYCYTASNNFYGDSMEEVLVQAEQDEPKIRQWYDRFRVS